MQNGTAEAAVTVWNRDQQQLVNYDDKEKSFCLKHWWLICACLDISPDYILKMHEITV